MRSNTRRNALYVYPIMALLSLSAQRAFAAGAPAAAIPDKVAPVGSGDLLDDVVVTATRQVDTVNRVPMSINAITQDNLTAEGIKSIVDLVQYVPGLQVQNQVAGKANFTIRGIGANTGAATTGVYLDDTALTRRSNSGVNQNNGSPLPVVYDLDRVEVLKGPQGTLYGGSSEGGTIRMITRAPSLTTFSGTGRAEVSDFTGHGSIGYELDAAVGGPIVKDKLGVRFSITDRHTGGFIDLVNPYNKGALVKADADQNDNFAGRIAVRWAVDPKTTVTFSSYYSHFQSVGGPAAALTPLPAGTTFTTPAVCNSVIRPATVAAGQPWNPAAVACPANAVPGQIVNNIYMRPSQTYGPFDYLNGNNTILPPDGRLNPAHSKANINALTIDRAFEYFNVKSVTSYVWDSTSGNVPDNSALNNVQTTNQNPGKTNFPLFSLVQNYAGRFLSSNRTREIEEELRISSPDSPSRLNWVAGLYFSHTITHIHYNIVGNYNPVDQALYGISQATKYGLPDDPNNILSTLDALSRETELAGFGEANFFLTPQLKLTAGLRKSQEDLNFTQSLFGIVPNILPVASGKSSSSPITPKFGVEYQFSNNNFVYANATQGFRPGGVNTQLNPALCTTGLALLGMTIADVPQTYAQDSVWSYEVGSKTRLLDNRLQLNVAAYRIDWSNVQTAIAAQGCGQNWTVNGGTARSQGAELQAQFRPFAPLTLSLDVGYDDARYTAPVVGPKPISGAAASIFFNKGDTLGVPAWQISTAAQYNFEVFNAKSFIRVDWVFTGPQQNGPSYGAGNFNPFTHYVKSTDLFNLRAGTSLGRWDVSAYAKNLTNSHEAQGNAGTGIAGCTAAGGPTCTTYNNFNPFVAQAYQRPRQVGIQINRKF